MQKHIAVAGQLGNISRKLQFYATVSEMSFAKPKIKTKEGQYSAALLIELQVMNYYSLIGKDPILHLMDIATSIILIIYRNLKEQTYICSN